MAQIRTAGRGRGPAGSPRRTRPFRRRRRCRLLLSWTSSWRPVDRARHDTIVATERKSFRARIPISVPFGRKQTSTTVSPVKSPYRENIIIVSRPPCRQRSRFSRRFEPTTTAYVHGARPRRVFSRALARPRHRAMMMLQNPLFQEYNTALSQLLELHQQQHRYQHQQQQQQQHHHHLSRHQHRGGTGAAAAPPPPTSAAAAAAGAFQTYAAAGGAVVCRTNSRDSAESDGLSSSSPRPSKPFTIDAILGLQAGQSAAAAAVLPVDPSAAVTALDFSTGSSAAHGKKHCREEKIEGSSKKHGCSGKSKRVRTIFTPEQLERLEMEFERQQYMVGPERLYLAHTLQLTEAQVKVWFQNRRIKWRKQHLEIQQQRLANIHQRSTQGMVQECEEDEDSETEANNCSYFS